MSNVLKHQQLTILSTSLSYNLIINNVLKHRQLKYCSLFCKIKLLNEMVRFHHILQKVVLQHILFLCDVLLADVMVVVIIKYFL